LDRKKKLYFEQSSGSSHSATSSSSSTSFSSSSSSSSTFSSSSSSSSSSRTQHGSQGQDHPDHRLTTLTEEERRRYEEEKKLGFETEEELSRIGGSRGSGHYEQHYTSESSYGTGSLQGTGRVHGGGVRTENEPRRRVEDQGTGYGVMISAGGAGAGAAGVSRTHSSRNFSATWSENNETPRRYSNYSYSNWTSGEDASGVGTAAYGRAGHEDTRSHHSSSSSAATRHGYSRQAGSSAHSDTSGRLGNVQHYSTNWSLGGTEGSGNVGRGYQGAGYGGAGTHFTFSTETSDISDNIGASYQSSHLSSAGRTGSAQSIDNRTRFRDHQTWSPEDNTHGFDNADTNQYGSELEESARGSGGFRHYIWTPEISGDPVSIDNSRHQSSSSGLDSTRGHIGRNSHIGIETDSATAGQQWHSGSGSSQYGVIGGEEASRRQHGTSHSSLYSWSTVDGGGTQHHSLNNDHEYDAWRRGHNAYGTTGDNVDVSKHYSSSYGHDYNADRRGSGTRGGGSGNVDAARHYSSSSFGFGDAAGQYGSGGEHRSGSQHYSSHYESGTHWNSNERTAGENKLEGSEDESSGQLKLYRKYRHYSPDDSGKGKQSRRQRRNVDDAELERATHCNTTRCSKMRCVLGPMAKGEEVKFAFRFLVWAETLKSVSFVQLN